MSYIYKEVDTMCNLGQGIEDRAIERTNEKFILSMNKKGYTLEQIADITEISETEVEAIINKNESVLA